MVALGMVIVAFGLIGIIYGVFMKMKAGRVAGAPLASTGGAARGEGAAPNGAIAAQGRVVVQNPLTSPMTGTPCLYYKIETVASWKVGDQTKTKTIDEQKHAAQFGIDDGSGVVWVDAHEGGDFEPEQVREQTQTPGLLGGITGTDLAFGNYRVSTGALAMGTKYTVKERVLPIQQNLYACGKAASGSIAAPGWRQLILSNKSRDELLASATKTAKISLIAGAAAFALGGALAVVGQLVGGDEAPKPTTAVQADGPSGG